jgi:hypothetical protein
MGSIDYRAMESNEIRNIENFGIALLPQYLLIYFQ